MRFPWSRPSVSGPDFTTLQLFEWTHPDPRPRLRTREDYERTFARNLVGTWSNNDAMMPDPMSQDIVFSEDGTGEIGGPFFTAFSGSFEWREAGERLMEIRSEDEPDAWHPVRWWFGGDRPVLYLDPASDETEEMPELIVTLTMDPLILSDPRGWPETPHPDPVPDDAEPITLNGAPAWLSHGQSPESQTWKLHQPPYEVMVANFQEGKRARHRFSLQYMSKGGKRMFGHCADADGHLDRPTFLNLAAKVLQGIQEADA